MSHQGEKAYKNIQVQTTNPGKLIVMLYDGAIKFLNIAKTKMDYKTYDVVNSNIQKTQDILDELMISLDMSQGEIAQRLQSIYLFINRLLLEANVEKDAKKIEKAIDLLVSLRDAWNQAADSKSKGSGSQEASKSNKSINIST